MRFAERKCGKCVTGTVSWPTELLNSAVKSIPASINYKIIWPFSSGEESMYCFYRS